MNFITRYITEALEELHHVRWPTRQQAVRLSAIVFAFTLGAAAVFGAVDYILSIIVKTLLSFS